MKKETIFNIIRSPYFAITDLPELHAILSDCQRDVALRY